MEYVVIQDNVRKYHDQMTRGWGFEEMEYLTDPME
jgi:hypothetical protein